MIELKNISKRYFNKKEKKVFALKDCNITLDSKSLVIISGKSGSGKTTLINLIGSLDIPTSGDILYNNQSIYSNSDQYRNNIVGIIFQEHNLFEHLTVRENIRLSLELQGKSISDEKIMDVLNKVSLQDYIDKYPNELSTGQHQRCAIARVLIKSPQIIIADEPTGSLDEKNALQVMKLFKKLSQEYLVILVTHNLSYAKKYADRHILLEDGVIVKDKIINEMIISKDICKDSINKGKKRLAFNVKINFVHKFFKKNIKHSIRTILTISLSLFLLILLYSISNIDESKMLYNTINSNSSDSVYYINNIFIKDNNNVYDKENIGFYIQDIEDMQKEYKDNKVLPIYRNSSLSLDNYVDIPNDLLYKGEISGIIELNSDVLNEFNFKLIEGRLPEESSNDSVDVAIPKFIFEYFKIYGIEQMQVSEYNDIIGKVITYKNINYKITGIVDTNYNIDYYKGYFLKSNSQIDIKKIEEYTKLISSEVQTALFVPSHYMSKIINESNQFTVRGLEHNFRITSSNYFQTSIISHISKYRSSDDIIWSNSSISNLKTNEVIIDFSLLNVNWINNNIKQLIYAFSEENFYKISDEFERQSPNSTFQDYAEYILSNDTNIFQPDKSYQNFQSEILKKVIGEINSTNPSFLINSIKGQFQNEIVVAGISLSNNNTLIVSDTNFNKIKSVSFGPYDSVMIKSSNNYENDKKIIDRFIINKRIDNSTLSSLYDFISIYRSFHIYSFSLLISVTFLTVILIFYFIFDLLKNARKDIGLFLALGTSKKDIRGIYLIKTSIIILTSQMLGIVYFLIVAPMTNSYMKIKFKLIINSLYLNFRALTYSIITVLLILGISSMLIIMKIMNKKDIKSLYY